MRLSRTDADVLQLTSADRAAYMRACQVLGPTNVSIETAAAQFADAKKALGDVPLMEAVEYYIRRHQVKTEPRLIKQVVEDMLAAKKQDGLSACYLKHLRYDLEKFSKAFSMNIGSVSGDMIDRWLRELGVSGRTRNNLRTSVQTLFSYAKSKRYLQKDHDELDAVPLAKNHEGEIEVFTPAELAEIFACADDRLKPFLALGAFAGVRHAEIQRLDWKDIRFDDGIVEIRASKAKTASRRLIPITNALKDWLLKFRQPAGPVCIYRNVAAEIDRLQRNINKRRGEAAGENAQIQEFKWKHNALRHSFISYRVAELQNVAQVALEAGNSPQMIFRHYRELVRAADAKTWFSIVPAKDGQIIGLDPLPQTEPAEERENTVAVVNE